ncbi:Transcriptional regulator, TetR family [Halanaerobium saccharolyticum subsp. saccharolyticum DSM 6643]|uniref:Transcriptional regulator, TetR family n=1 Tax=Halanaerobium saccharolyticum subsp. saccharolyticum DSM 6643 TaxID=1293054 RepID=M5E1J6_9FIRM|nr:TetR/AcrR family transcriptional regulator [Halanaerobium saccharolyticum]CCU80177.1 Transcriptional regulator, TetR family [Halanaerobium saccharolyticum subsp. saccharolyticum DSM 6643]
MAEDTRNKILESAVELFSKSNYHAVSMTEIANGADISKGTLYWYFDSKEELFREIAVNGMDYFYNQFKRIAQTDKNSEEKINNLIQFVLNTLVKHLNMLDVFRNNVELISNDFKNNIEAKHQKNIDIVAEIIKQGIDEGLIKDEKPCDISTMLLSVLFTPHTNELFEKAENKESKIKFIYDFIMNGISRKEHHDAE